MPVDLNLELRLSYLRAAQAAQQEIEKNIATYRDFFDGDQGVELTTRQDDYLTKDVTSFGNICKRVINIIKDRLEITPDGIRAANPASEKFAELATDWWTQNRLAAKQKDIYEASLRDSNVGIIVGYDDTKGVPTFTPNLILDAAQTGLLRFHYDSDDNLLFASKRWTIWNPIQTGETGKRRMTIYRPGLIERYEADPRNPNGWRFLEPREIGGLPNPQIWTMDGLLTGEDIGLPVIPFENPGGSELADVINIQQLLNHSLGTFDIATDYHGFPLLWFVGLDLPIDATTGKAEMPDFNPGQGLNLRDGGSAGRVEVADLEKMFRAGVLSWVQVLAIIKGWPPFLLDKSGNVPSGVALRVLEGSLIKQVEDKQTVFSDSWRDAFEIARKLHNIKTGDKIEGELLLNWESAATADELAEAQAQRERFEAGQLPTISRWREMGFSKKQIMQFLEDAGNQDSFGMVAGELFAGRNSDNDN